MTKAECPYPDVIKTKSGNVKGYRCRLADPNSKLVTNRQKLPCVGLPELFNSCAEADSERLVNLSIGGHFAVDDDSANADTGSNPAKTFEESR